MEPQRQTVGIRELKQNPSEIIAKAAAGARFSVLSHGKAVGVVIEREKVVRGRWVSSADLTALTADSKATGGDGTGWMDDLRRQREQGGDEIVDPWAGSSQDETTP